MLFPQKNISIHSPETSFFQSISFTFLPIKMSTDKRKTHRTVVPGNGLMVQISGNQTFFPERERERDQQFNKPQGQY